MTMDFSQRMGLRPAIKVAQVESIDRDLQNSLWSVIVLNLFNVYHCSSTSYPNTLRRSNFWPFAVKTYSDFYKAPVDTIPTQWPDLKKTIRTTFFDFKWHRLYSFLEFIVSLDHENTARGLTLEFNRILERENSAYRFISGKITPITSNDEIEEIEKAISAPDNYSGVRTHLQTSLGHLTDRENPDYRNSIKESISAVESLTKKLVGDDKATLGQALKILETKHNLHASLKSAFMTLYGYTSDAGGIRHALLDNTAAPTKADARFMLICCSAFINFAIDSIED